MRDAGAISAYHCKNGIGVRVLALVNQEQFPKVLKDEDSSAKVADGDADNRAKHRFRHCNSPLIIPHVSRRGSRFMGIKKAPH